MNRLLALASLVVALGCTASSPSSTAASAALDSARTPTRAAPAAIDKRRHSALRALSNPVDKQRRLGLPTAPKVTPAPLLSYQNGPLIDSVEIYAVFWGSKVDPATTAGLPGFYQSISSDAPYMQMLSEYNTGAYVLGHGTFKGAVVDASAPAGTFDSTANTYTVQDVDVQAELSRLVDTGVLPAPDGHNIFMVYFDPQTLIGQGTCTSFCAYHNSFSHNGQAAYYGIMPDLGHNGCEQGCGFNTALNNLYSASSHELIEAMTDADVGNGNYGWIDTTSGNEIGDICTDWDGTAAAGYNVQSMWSNESNGCRDHRPSTVTTGTITTIDATVAPGGTATYNIKTTGTAPGPWTLAVEDYVVQQGNKGTTPEYPITFAPATVSPGGSAVLTITVPANETVFGFGTQGYQLLPHIAATDANGVHRFIEVELNVVTAAPKITKIAPATGPTIGGTAVTVTGSDFADDATGYFCPTTGTCDPNTNAVPVVGGQPSSDGKSFTFTTPDYAAGAARFMLSNPADSTHPVYANFTFTVGANTAPTITSVSPASGPTAGGTTITITGTNFDQGTAAPNGNTPVPNLTLAIGGTAVTSQNFFVADAQHIVATTPKHAAGAVAIKVTNADKQTVTLNNAFTYGTGNAAADGLTLSPTMGSTLGGTYVVIEGNDLVQGATVTFGGVAATVQTFNPSFVGVVAPAHAAGPVSVVVTNPNAPASTSLTFTFVVPPPGDMAVVEDLAVPVILDLSPGADLAGQPELDGGVVQDLSTADLATGHAGGGGSGGGGGTGGGGGGSGGGHAGGGGGKSGGGCSAAGSSAPAAPSVALLGLALLVLARRRRSSPR